MYKILITLLLAVLVAVPVLAKDSTEVKADSTTIDSMATAEKTKKVADSSMAEEAPEMKTTELGVRYQDLVVGKGNPAKLGTKLECHYTLWLADSTGMVKGKFLQSSKDKGKTFSCELGVNLIPGWSDGMVEMEEGGTRRLYIPWELGYGVQGMGRMIPGKTNLIFEIEYVAAM